MTALWLLAWLIGIALVLAIGEIRKEAAILAQDEEAAEAAAAERTVTIRTCAWSRGLQIRRHP